MGNILARVMAFLRNLGTDLRDAWSRLSLSARTHVALTLGVTAVIMAIILAIGSRPQFVRLYSRLDPEDMAAVTAYLEDQDIAYEVKDQGAAINVPSAKRTAVMVELGARDIPSKSGTGIGFEIFDQQDFMTDRFLQDVNLQRAIEGKIVRMLESMDFIQRASVHITHAKRELFAKNQMPSKAAVILDVDSELSNEQIKGITHMVANTGGPYLSPEQVAITRESDGKFLHKPPSDTFTALASSQLEHKNEVETYLETKLRDFLLESGQEKASVGVSATVSFDTVRKTEQLVSEGVALSELKSTTEITSSESLPEGPPGASSNPPDDVSAVGTRTSEETTEDWTNNDPSRTITETESQPGQITDIAVAVTLEGAYSYLDENDAELQPDESGTVTPRYVGMTEDELTAWQEKLARVAGTQVQPENVFVDHSPFSIQRPVPLPAPEGIQVAAVASRWWHWGSQAAKVLAVLIGLFIVRRLLLSAIVRPSQEPAEEEQFVDIEEMRRRDINEAVEHMSKDNPERVASLLRSWIGETEE